MEKCLNQDVKNRVLKLTDKAENLFISHRSICQIIGNLLDNFIGKEIIDVVYQPSDGLCVVIENEEIGTAPLNIPIKQFLEKGKG